MTEELCEDECSGKTKRYGEDNSQRQDVTLILSRQDKIYEHDTHHEDDGSGVARLTLRTCQTRVVDTITLGQYLLGNLLDGTDGVTRRITGGCRRIDIDGSEEVESVDIGRAIYSMQITELLDRRHTTRSANIYTVETIRTHTACHISLDHYSIELTIGIHV